MNRACGIILASAICLLSGCAPAPPRQPLPPEEPARPDSPPRESAREVPELTLNLPSEHCACPAGEEQELDRTFLQRGLNALASGSYIDAVQYFQRYQRIEKDPQADWEAGIAIAYVSMLPSSPFYDPDEAAVAYRRLAEQFDPSTPADVRVLLMRESLQTFLVLDRHVKDLESTNATLREDLVKRERALKRLRELTLGQPGEQR